jgi:hypothetical protein
MNVAAAKSVEEGASFSRLQFSITTEAQLNLLGSFGRNTARELEQLLSFPAIAKNLRHLFESFGASPAIQTSIDESSKLRRRSVTSLQ